MNRKLAIALLVVGVVLMAGWLAGYSPVALASDIFALDPGGGGDGPP